MVFHVHEDAMFFCGGEEGLLVLEGFDGGFGDENVDLAFNGVEGDAVMGCVWGKDRDGVSWRESVNGGFVGFWVALVVWGE